MNEPVNEVIATADDVLRDGSVLFLETQIFVIRDPIHTCTYVEDECT